MAKDKLQWWVLATVIIGTFLGRLDQTIVGLALPNIIQDFSITVSAAAWISTAYIIANAVFVPVWGKLGDMIGRKKVYIWGFGLFIFGSILAGAAWNLKSMIVFRIIQAIAGSADYPTAMAIIAVTFKEGKERAQALGIWSASFAAAVVFGPLLGGPLIDWFGWRAVFFINIPIGLIGILMAYVFVHESKSEKKIKDFDWNGAVVLGITLSALVLVLDQGRDWGWLSLNSGISYLVVLISAGMFYRIEKGHKEPIVDLKFFKNEVFVGTLINNFIVFMGMVGGIFLIPIFVQTYMGYSATQSGLLFIPMAFCMLLFAQIGGRMVGKIKASKVIFISTIIAALGLLLFPLFIDARSTALDVIIPLAIFAGGMGFGMAQRTSAIASAVPKHEIGVASSVLALSRNIAGAFGIAIFATLLNNFIESNVLATASNSVINSANPLVFKEVAALIILKAQIVAYQEVFLVAGIIVLIGAIASLFLKISKETKEEVIVEG